jgi:hypothetical protein
MTDSKSKEHVGASYRRDLRGSMPLLRDELLDDLDRGALRYLVAVGVLLIVFGLGWCARAPIVNPTPIEHTAFVSASAEREYKQLLKKHGLDRDVSIIYEDHLGQYFIRNARRCTFR